MLTLVALVTSLFMGLGCGVARAADYPLPTAGDGQVDSSIVSAGQCVQFSGGGFQPGSTVSIEDNGRHIGTERAGVDGTFTHTVCFGTDATLGEHVLTGRGIGANGAARVVSAIVTVMGVSVLQPVLGGDGGGSTGTGSGLPFTGSDLRDLVAFGGALILAGLFLVRRGKRQRRARRRLGPASA